MGKSNVKKYIRGRLPKNPVIVEVGAHYGEDSVDFLKVMTPSCVHCFEPDPRNIYIFKKYVRDERISLHEFAVSDTDGDSIDFYLSYTHEIKPKMFKKYHWIDKEDYINMKINSSGASSLRKGHPLLDKGETVSVSTTRLDTWAIKNNVENIDFLWIDVQGAERGVVKGFGDMSQKIKCVWIEFGEDGYDGYMSRKETISMFNSLGFVLDDKKSNKGKKGNLLFWSEA